MIAKFGVNIVFHMVGEINGGGMIRGRRSGKILGRITHGPAKAQEINDMSIVVALNKIPRRICSAELSLVDTLQKRWDTPILRPKGVESLLL